jgi:hypothetical protein
MKYIFKLVLVLCVFTFNSCEKEEVPVHENQNSFENFKRTDSSPSSTTMSPLEIRKQWVAYLTAQAILNDIEARQEFLEALNGNFVGSLNVNADVVSLANLISYSTSSDSYFIHAFETEYNYTFGGENCGMDEPGPGGVQTNPRGRPIPPPPPTPVIIPPGASPNPIDTSFSIYLNDVLVNYNFEFYLPNGCNDLVPIEFISSADDALANTLGFSNEGFRHLGQCDVYNMIVSYQNQGNVIIVR